MSYFSQQTGVYLQDDIRLRKNLTLSPGVRYEIQAHVSDYSNVGPRLGLTWSPFKNGRTTVRSSTGIFYDWLGQSTYEQALRLDGFHQQELNIVNPTYPNPEISESRPPRTDISSAAACNCSSTGASAAASIRRLAPRFASAVHTCTCKASGCGVETI